MKRTMVIALGATLLLASCFRERQTVTQIDSMSKIRFTGKTSGTEFRADRDGNELWGWTKVETGKVYEAKPGKCTIQVRRSGAVIVRRDMLLVDGQAIEIAVP